MRAQRGGRWKWPLSWSWQCLQDPTHLWKSTQLYHGEVSPPPPAPRELKSMNAHPAPDFSHGNRGPDAFRRWLRSAGATSDSFAGAFGTGAAGADPGPRSLPGSAARLGGSEVGSRPGVCWRPPSRLAPGAPTGKPGTPRTHLHV